MHSIDIESTTDYYDNTNETALALAIAAVVPGVSQITALDRALRLIALGFAYDAYSNEASQGHDFTVTQRTYLYHEASGDNVGFYTVTVRNTTTGETRTTSHSLSRGHH
ncbi:hypothetical protein [Alkalibacillus silvisoli]|uniref:Uncharacterized protein n=1 Tax=Alkalibacillus silvisoli TaxID=392823 RepID=A0ABN1A068_9BACI